MNPISDISYQNRYFLAGNSRISFENGLPVVEAQIIAFEKAALEAVRLSQMGCTVSVSVAFDHKGVFRKQFLRNGLPNSRQRHPRITDLLPDFSNAFIESATRVGYDCERILAIHEDSARTHVAHLVSQENIELSLKERMIVIHEQNEASCGLGKATCAAITAEYYRAALRPLKNEDVEVLLDVYFENTPWALTGTYVRGISLAHRLGVGAAVRLNLVSPDGQVASGAIAKSSKKKEQKA